MLPTVIKRLVKVASNWTAGGGLLQGVVLTSTGSHGQNLLNRDAISTEHCLTQLIVLVRGSYSPRNSI